MLHEAHSGLLIPPFLSVFTADGESCPLSTPIISVNSRSHRELHTAELLNKTRLPSVSAWEKVPSVHRPVSGAKAAPGRSSFPLSFSPFRRRSRGRAVSGNAQMLSRGLDPRRCRAFPSPGWRCMSEKPCYRSDATHAGLTRFN